ncbi:transcription factor [Fusarium mexicanum]|uniref:Transcription factor n=1 Tax=Fusarium mexicanum TaxID=751941 RepID=A0A8H5IMN5_9HYPO|nr:transcription factor [Fusarium mexicanum]
MYDSDVEADSQFKNAKAVMRHYRHLAQASSRDYSNRPTIPTIRANLALGLCELLTMAGSKAWLHIGLAIRFAQTLRMRSEHNRRLSPYQREIRRRTFWACITLDRVVAYSTFRTQTIRLDLVELHLPYSEAAFVFGRDAPGPRIEELGRELQDNSDSLVLAYLVKTVLFWSPIAQSFVEHGRRLLSGKNGAEAWERYWQSEAAITIPITTASGSAFNEQSLTSTQACVDGAMQIVNMLRTIERVTKELPPNLFAGTAISTSASVLLWVRYCSPGVVFPPGFRIQEPDMARQDANYLLAVLDSWAGTWPRARAWANSIRLLDEFYRSRRGGRGLPRAAPPDETMLQNERSEPDSGSGSPIHLWDGDGLPDVSTIPREAYYKVRMITGLILEQPEICRSILQMRDDEPSTEQSELDPVSWQADFDFSWMEDTDIMAEHSVLTDYAMYLDI